MSPDAPHVPPQPRSALRRRLRWLVPALLVVAAYGYWRIDLAQLRGNIGESLGRLDKTRSLRGPALIEFGAQNAPFVAVLAWNPLDIRSNNDLLQLADWADDGDAQLPGGVRLVVLPVVPATADKALAGQLLGLHRGELLLDTVRSFGAKPVASAALCKSLGAKNCTDLGKAVLADDLDVSARALARIATALQLQPGDLLLNGRRVAADQVHGSQALSAEWHAEIAKIAALVQKIGDDPAQVQEQALHDAATPQLAADRYLHWIVRHLRMRAT